MHLKRALALISITALWMLQAGCRESRPAIVYPGTQTVDHVDTYHGVEIADPYRWLEPNGSAAVEAWAAAQNALVGDLHITPS